MLGTTATATGQQILYSPPPISTTPPSVQSEQSDHAGFLGTSPVATALSSPLSLFHWGAVSGRPHFSYTATYGTGISSSPGNKSSSLINQIFPGILFNIGTHWTLDYTPNLVYYSSGNLKDTLNHNVSLSGGFSYGDWIFGVNQSYSFSSNPNSETAAQTGVEAYTTQLSASYRFNSKYSLDASISQVLNSADQFNSSKSWATTEYLNYQFAPRLTAGVGLTFGYDSVSIGPDATHEQLLARVQWRLGEKLSLDIHGGAEDRQYVTGGVPDSITPVFGASINYTPAEQTTIGLSADRSISPSLFSNQSSTSTSLNVSVTQRLVGVLNLNAGVGYSKREYSSTILNNAAGPRSDDAYTFTSRLGYPFSKHASIAGSYQYTRNNSSTGGFGYDSSQVGLEFSYNF